MSDADHADPSVRDARLSAMQTSLPHVSELANESETREVAAEPDPVKVGMQEWAVVSVVEEADKGRLALKIRGCFDTPAAAEKHAARLAAIDPYFDIYIVKMYHWLVLPIDEHMQRHIDRRYMDPRLQQIMDSYKESLTAAGNATLEKHAALQNSNVVGKEDDDAGGSGESDAPEPRPPTRDPQDADTNDREPGP